MSNNLSRKMKRIGREAGVALLTTLLLLFLMSSLLVGFAILLMSNQQLAGADNDDVQAFYGAEAGMEQLTAGLGNLFAQTYAPGIGQINALQVTPPTIPGVTFATADGHSGYLITPQAVDLNGNPAPTVSTIKSGPYIGMNALVTEYTLTVNARTTMGREVKLQRTTQTVGIPMFQFGVFSDMDLTFHAGPDFSFGGRTHTNGNLFLAEGTGATLTMKDKVDAYKDVIRTNLADGWPSSNGYAGTVNITTNPGSTSYRSLGMNEGSLTAGAGCTGCANTNWPRISTGSAPSYYNSNLLNGPGSEYPLYSTGARQLNLGIVTIGSGTTQTIDIIRRPVPGESSNVTGERYYAGASLRVLLSDNPNDIMQLPCIDSSKQPLDLSVMAQPVANWPTTGSVAAIKTALTNANLPVLPLAASGAAANATAYNPADGYWLPNSYPIIKGFIKIEAQTTYGSPCGTWQDVTTEILSLGYVGRNINPVSQSIVANTLWAEWPGTTTQMDPLSNGSTHYYTTSLATATPPNQLTITNSSYGYPLGYLPTAQEGPQGAAAMAAGTFTNQNGSCMDPHPNAVIRLERIRDNPSSLYAAHYKNSSNNWVPYIASGTKSTSNQPVMAPVAVVCGVDPATGKLPIVADTNGTTAVWTPQPFDFWPNALFDTREGELRETVLNSGAYQNLPTLNGTMHYVEIDANNLVKWFAGTIGVTGPNTKDQAVAPNDFSVYISDRRGNYASAKTWTPAWPPLSPSGHETGEYGWNDIANGTVTNGCQNGNLDPGEDLAGTGVLYTYGVNATNTNYVMSTANATNPSQLYTFTGTWPPPGASLTGNSAAYGAYGFYPTLVSGSPAALLANNFCAYPSYGSASGIWPMSFASAANAARVNPPIFFRRAVKIINGKLLTALGTCPSGAPCGLTIATENPMYIMGDYNANSAGGGFSDAHVATSVAADALTLLSNNWNDINSFAYAEYNLTGANVRNATTTYWRTAAVAGKGIPFPYFNNNADNGSDGGIHNFLRYIEDWGGQTLYYTGSIISMYYNRQATGIFKCCATVYAPPTRGYQFDVDFLNPTLLPPRTPLFRDTNTTGWTRLMLPTQ